jgi:DNA-binding FadR family transcriptional regulator
LSAYEAHIFENQPINVEQLTTARKVYQRQIAEFAKRRRGPVDTRHMGESYNPRFCNSPFHLHANTAISVVI